MIKDPTKLLNIEPKNPLGSNSEQFTVKLEKDFIGYDETNKVLLNYTGKGLWEQLPQQPSLNKYTYITTGIGGKKMFEDAIDEYFTSRITRREVNLTDKSTSELIDMALNDIDKLK